MTLNVSENSVFFNFNREKLLALGKTAAEHGIEMLVLDDGWFGHRDDDTTSLGDWTVNTTKLGGTMAQLSDDIHALGLKFGLWFEPEMVSEDSDLFRAHPDWALQVPGRPRSLGRHQMVLDLARPEVVDSWQNCWTKKFQEEDLLMLPSARLLHPLL